MIEPDVWRQLSLFERAGLVRRFYRERHGRSLSAGKARDIVAHLLQGRDYFASARQAAEPVRPLLLYHGVLALSRAAILYLDRGHSGADTLSPQHGLGATDWMGHLAGRLDRLADLGVGVQRGTFTELLRVTGNEERIATFVGPERVRMPWSIADTTAIPAGHAISLKEVVGRVPELPPSYERTFATHAPMHPTAIHSLDSTTTIVLPETALGLPDEAHLRAELQLPHDVNIRIAEHHPLLGAVTHYHFGLFHPSLAEMMTSLPPVRNDRAGRIYPVAPLDFGGTRAAVSSLAVLYMIAYMMGMLVRYHPSVWLALTSRESGDLMLPLLQAAVAVVEERFP